MRYTPVVRTALLLLLGAGCASGGAAAAAPDAELRIDLDAKGPAVSPSLYGLFFEEINHAGDGGLYAELVRNRSFEDADVPEGWSLDLSDGGRGAMSVDRGRPLNERNPSSLRIDVLAPGRVAAVNAGYWGMGVRRGEPVRVSLWARAEGGLHAPLTVALESSSGQKLASDVTGPLTDTWSRHTVTLRPNATMGAARLAVVAGAAPGSVWLDMVSAMPERTWKRRANGLRADLAAMLHAVRPAFVRFPGGCFVEGNRIANAWRWKNTIGPVEERIPHWNLWGYRSSNGLGYHEYLQMCEDLGAAPLLVINCGMAHEDHVPMAQLGEWVQDALDAIEYANGPVSSPWGARRAAAGHPAPFGLRLVEIGNENGGPLYEERYAAFHDAIRKRHPDIRLIANVPVQSRPMDILDEHYYSSPEWFLQNATRYDAYDRTGPRIYVGEYAVTVGCGQGNLRAALAEAAFMMGMERNADIVTMASYAPLFVNMHNRAWNPDAIVFDSLRAFGTPSYHVQRLFSLNRPERIVPVSLRSTALPAAPTPGRIGLGTWATVAEFRDVRVTASGRTLMAADFAAGPAGWTPLSGEWTVVDGAYRQSSTATGCRSDAGDPSWTDYTLTLRARKLSGAEGFLIVFRARDDRNFYWWNLGGWGNQRHAIEKSVGGGKSEIGRSVPGRIEEGRWYDIRIELEGPRIRCYLDGALIHDVVDEPAPDMVAVAGTARGGRELIVKVVNAAATPRETSITFSGAARVAGSATLTVLAGHPDDESSLSQPERIAPHVRRIAGVGTRWVHTFPAHSLSVLRVALRPAPSSRAERPR